MSPCSSEPIGPSPLVGEVVEKPTPFEVAIGSLTDVEYTVTVTDTCTSALYESVDGSLDNFGDDTTFPNVPC